MNVETYECAEVKAEHPEIAEEAIALIEKLELDGQKSLIAKPDEDLPATRCPYREMKAEEIFVFGYLCPEKTEASRYSAGPIPIRVLQVFEHAKSLGMFRYFQIWAAKGAVKDPVLVAFKDDRTYLSANRPFILARWADELDAWPQLVKKAVSFWKAKARSEVEKIQQKLNADKAMIDACSSIELPVDRDIPSYYGWS